MKISLDSRREIERHLCPLSGRLVVNLKLSARQYFKQRNTFVQTGGPLNCLNWNKIFYHWVEGHINNFIGLPAVDALSTATD